MSTTHRGTSFDDFLREDGLLEDVHDMATRRVIAWQIRHQMEVAGISKSELARRMNTSRSQVDRILEGNDPGIRLDTLERGAEAVGCKLRIELVK